MEKHSFMVSLTDLKKINGNIRNGSSTADGILELMKYCSKNNKL